MLGVGMGCGVVDGVCVCGEFRWWGGELSKGKMTGRERGEAPRTKVKVQGKGQGTNESGISR